MPFRILAINPGSTSTKIGYYEDVQPVLTESLQHPAQKLATFKTVAEQYSFRRNAILSFLQAHDIQLEQIDAFCGRGGLLKPIPGGVYRVNAQMKSHLSHARYGEHASNLGALLADELAGLAGGRPALIVNPVVVDELQDVARFSGMPENPRRSVFHALNHKAVAARYARSIQARYEDLCLVVAHLGGGITVGAHRYGRVVDVNDGLSGDGPFSPERTGGVPTLKLAALCFSGRYEPETMKHRLVGRGGLVAYLHTNNAREVEARVENGDPKARAVYEAMAYQVGKEIGAMHAVLHARTDAIILTGGLAHSKLLVQWITGMVGELAPVIVYPGEDELLAMVEESIKALKGETRIRDYS